MTEPQEYIITFDELQFLKPGVSNGMYRSTKEMNQEKTVFGVLSRPAKESSNKVLDERMIAWIREGERGISSEVIFEVLADHPLLEKRYDFATPSDASDFYRCFELIRAIPEWEGRLNEVSEKHPHWKLLIEHWQELKLCVIDDIAKDGRSCNRLLNKLNKYRYAPEQFKEELRTKDREHK